MDWPHAQKNALKTALGVTLAYGIALWLNWDNPMWAALGVYITRLPYAGMTLHKIFLRVIGTFVGAAIALAIIGLTAELHWVSLACITVNTGFWFVLSMRTGGNGYAYRVTGFVSYIIWTDTIFAPHNAFTIASYRVSETILGIVIGALVSVLLWPDLELPAIDQKMEELRRTLARFAKNLAAAMEGDKDAAEALPATGAQLSKLLSDLEGLFVSANRSNFFEARLQLHSDLFREARELRDHLGALATLVRQYPQSLDSDLARQMADWARSHATALEQMIWHETGDAIDLASWSASTHKLRQKIDQYVSENLQQADSRLAATAWCRAARDDLVAITNGVGRIAARLDNRPSAAGERLPIVGETAPKGPLGRAILLHGVTTTLAQFATGALWFTVYLPSGGAAVQFGAIVQMVMMSAPVFFPSRQFFGGLGIAHLLGLLTVFLLLPRLDGFAQLSLVIFLLSYLWIFIQEIPGKGVFALIGYVGLLGVLMISSDVAPNYNTLLAPFLGACIAQWVGGSIGLLVAKIINPDSPGQEFCRNVEETLRHFWLAPGDNSEGSQLDSSQVDLSPAQLQDQRQQRQASLDLAAFWRNIAAPTVTPSQSQAMGRITQSLEVCLVTLNVLGRSRATQLPRLTVQGREIEAELYQMLGRVSSHFQQVVADSATHVDDGLLVAFRQQIDGVAHHARDLMLQQPESYTVDTLSLLAHYQSVYAALRALSDALSECDLELLSRNRFT